MARAPASRGEWLLLYMRGLDPDHIAASGRSSFEILVDHIGICGCRQPDAADEERQEQNRETPLKRLRRQAARLSIVITRDAQQMPFRLKLDERSLPGRSRNAQCFPPKSGPSGR
ncbi:hypothetical protein ACTXI0_14220 [Arthrobacter rhombi]|uniref:hypothetical protein n=1 Tax=Arthrobacter rhombi TaxID=71253 RepID=UPI003FD23F3D